MSALLFLLYYIIGMFIKIDENKEFTNIIKDNGVLLMVFR